MDSELVAKVEAILFASGRFINAAQIAEMLECYQEDIQKAVRNLNDSYKVQESALHVVEEDGAYKLHVRDQYLELVSVDIRGSNAYDHIKELLEKDFITREPEGRTYRLRITEKFFEYFDIEGRDDIREVFKAVEEEHRKKEMELELEQRRLQQAIEAGDEAAEQEAEPLPDKQVDIDDLDAVLEKSARSREEMGASLKEAAGSDEDDEGPESSEEAAAIRERVERDAEELSK